MIVIDAAALTEYLIGLPEIRAAIDSEIATDGERLIHAPEVVDPETLNALRGLLFGGLVTERRALEAVDDLAVVPLIRYPHRLLRDRIWQLRHQLTAYDAAYLALAEGLDARLITADGGLAERARDSIGPARVRQLA